MTDVSKRAQIQALALAVASGFLIPPAAVVIETALILCWSFAESIVDLRELFHGGKVSALLKISGRLAAVTGESSESPAEDGQ